MDSYTAKNRKEILILATLCLLLEGILITADVLTFKITAIFGVILTIPALIYPLTYAIGDILTEVYGRKVTLTIFVIAVAIEFFFDGIISYVATIHNIYDPHYYSAFYYALGKTYVAATGVVIGSLFGFAINTFIMYFLKSKFSYRSFPIRSIASSLSGEIVFTITAFMIWFYSDSHVGTQEIIRLILSSAALKVVFASVCAYPAYLVAKRLAKNRESHGLKITNVERIGDNPGESIFDFQIIGKRSGFSLTVKKLSLNIYSALGPADQKLIQSDLKGEILSYLDTWMELHK